MTNEPEVADHLRTTWERYEQILGVRTFVDPEVDKGIQNYGSHIVDFIGRDKPWGSCGRVAIQKFRLDEPCVYFIGGDVGAIKIGTTIAPLERLASFQLGSPIKLKILALQRGGRDVERAYHTRFAEHRLHGEWFDRHADVLAAIDDLYFAPVHEVM